METTGLLIVLVGILLVAGVSKRIRHTIITLPMLYVLFGLLAGVGVRVSVGVFVGAGV